MEKKKAQDILLVRDEKTGELGVVAGLNADGTPKCVPAKPAHTGDFLKFDRHGDVLDNFFRNFFRQCKEPSRFGFYRIAAEQADKLLEVMKELLKNPAANQELLSPHKIDTSGYENKPTEEQKTEPPKQQDMEPQNERQANNPQEQSQQKTGYQPIDENKVDWQGLEEKWGVRRADLEKSGDLQKMLHYGKSDLVKVTPVFGGETFELDARLSFNKDAEGNIRLVPHFIRKEQKLDEYKGHKFSAEDRKNLRETGNLGRVVNLVNQATGGITSSYVSIDRKTKELTDFPAAKIRLPSKIGKTEITPQERDMLRAGLPVRDKLIEQSNGRKFVATLQVNVEQRGVEFVPGSGRALHAAQSQADEEKPGQSQKREEENGRQRRNAWTNADGSIKPIGKWKGVPLTEQQKRDYVAGKTVKLENIPDAQGNPSTLYIKFNLEKGKPYRYDTNPDTVRQGKQANKETPAEKKSKGVKI